jgi:hypothetical protein
MKTRIGFFALCLMLVGFTSTAKTKESSLLNGQSLTGLGDYQISQSLKAITIGNEPIETYELTYSNSHSQVLIGVKKTKKCTDFIVRAKNFEVEYVCNKHVFGVKRINKDYQTVPTATINKRLDNADFYTQRVISQNPKTEEELLGLIACYFPLLVKDDFQADL